MPVATDQRAPVQGFVAWYEPILPPSEYARQGRAFRAKALQALGSGQRAQVEKLARKAIERLVDAFLFDRSGHRSCFKEAHELGQAVARIFGCPLKASDDGEYWARDCGIPALHQRVGFSRAGTSLGRCSICNADDLECDHVRGKVYDGQRCFREIYEMTLPEISLVQFPDDPRCYRVQIPYSREQIEAAFDLSRPNAARPACTHCLDCEAVKIGATDYDVDQSRWTLLEP